MMDKFESESWFQLLEQKDALKRLSHEQLVTHLTILGWYPVESRREALQRGDDTVMLVEREGYLSARSTTQYPAGSKRGVSQWPQHTGRLLLLAERILDLEYAS